MPRSASANKGPQSSGFELRSRTESRNTNDDDHERRIQDDRQLLNLGKRPVLKRSFGFMSILGFSCTVLITWEGALILCSGALFNGGTAGVLWGFLLNWIGIFSAFMSIAELASMAPVSGGQFHWIALLAPPESKKFLSYLTGWVTVIGWQAVTLSSAFLGATVLEQTIVLVHPNWLPRPWQTMLVTWAVLALVIVINTISSRVLSRFEGLILIVHLLGFFSIIVPLVYFGPHGDASIFTQLYNGGKWSSKGLSFLVGLPSLVYTLFGADSAIHMSEEIQNASIAVPQALMLSLGINGILGFAILVALMFCMGSMPAALSGAESYGFTYIEIFYQAVGSKAGVTAMSSVVVALCLGGTVGSLAATTRLLWAFARENGFPFSSFIAKVDPTTVLPLNAIATTLTISMLLTLISLGSSIALEDIVNLSIASLFSSYLIVCAALLWRRLQGKIKNHSNETLVTGPHNLRWGPWRVPEPWGTINNAFACAFLIWTTFWTFWPPTQKVNAASMNYNVLVYGTTVLGGVVWYFAIGRRNYIGPIVEFDATNVVLESN